MKKNGDKKRKYLTAAALVLLSCAILAGSLLVGTYSKYRSGINGYTTFSPAQFRAGLVGDYDEKQLSNVYDRAMQDYNPALNMGGDPNNPIYYQSFRTFVNHDNLSPGMDVIKIPFNVTNGRTRDIHASVDIEYTIRIRSTCNLPLQFRLRKYLTKSGGDPIYDENHNQLTEVYGTTGEYYVEYQSEKDAPNYIWTMHKLALDKYDEVIEAEKEEGVFGMTGQRFTLDYYVLEITWPVYKSDVLDFNGNRSNSAVYMKEVDIVDVIVTLESTDRAYDDIPKEYDGSDRFDARGFVLVYPDGADYSYVSDSGDVSVFEYSMDYRGFRSDVLKIGNDNKNVKRNLVNFSNGAGIYTDGNLIKAEQPARYTFSAYELNVPYNRDTKDYGFLLNVNGVILTVFETEYRLYSVKYDSPDYGTYTVVTDPDVITELTSEDYNYSDSENRLFVNYRFTRADSTEGDPTEYIVRTENFNGDGVRSFSQTQVSVVLINPDSDSVTPINPSDTDLSSLSEKDNPITLRERSIWMSSATILSSIPLDQTAKRVSDGN